jgi:hypothetical protein
LILSISMFMNNLRARKRYFSWFAVTLFAIVLLAANASAQYSGAPVKVDRLIKALRSRQLQTDDIVAVIRTNGVTFALTPDVRKALIAAGARPEVITAIASNRRGGMMKGSLNARSEGKRAVPAYIDLLEKALNASETRRGGTISAGRYQNEAGGAKGLSDDGLYQSL